MIYATSNSFFTVWRGEIKDRYAEFSLSTSRKDKRDDSYKNSNWNFVRFVGDAFEKCKGLKERDRITNVTFSLECEPYTDRNGQTVYPKSPRLVVFSFDIAQPMGGTRPHSKPYANVSSSGEYEDITDEDMDLPF